MKHQNYAKSGNIERVEKIVVLVNGKLSLRSADGFQNVKSLKADNSKPSGRVKSTTIKRKYRRKKSER
jgi:3-deoxy-D-manno-octulosonic-acid transferase